MRVRRRRLSLSPGVPQQRGGETAGESERQAPDARRVEGFPQPERRHHQCARRSDSPDDREALRAGHAETEAGEECGGQRAEGSEEHSLTPDDGRSPDSEAKGFTQAQWIIMSTLLTQQTAAMKRALPMRFTMSPLMRTKAA